VEFFPFRDFNPVSFQSRGFFFSKANHRDYNGVCLAPGWDRSAHARIHSNATHYAELVNRCGPFVGDCGVVWAGPGRQGQCPWRTLCHQAAVPEQVEDDEQEPAPIRKPDASARLSALAFGFPALCRIFQALA
jgi:hypothetical protein